MFARRSTVSLIQRAFYSTKTVPAPTKEIPDVKTFLTKIGRKCEEHEDKFTEWKELFEADGHFLKEKGIDVNQRRYILSQAEKFRQGEKIMEYKQGKKSFYGGERTRKERVARLEAQKRAERYAHEDSQK
ncbi:CYFA0S16e00628g1_1 [Cyberlindnera fabianii]|uniref:Small ribosomal subunit protein mS41 n=1 Tax=Cyberlindnera fabianii TaxID=36022 RepID=A0A061B4U4_CYBFA|nr:Protein FYV4, mitochondrial [Cyberlindnera fabianii]CDR44971.1 CYFA0S16e00628g1_1 [Cyberlindnera fabianii]